MLNRLFHLEIKITTLSKSVLGFSILFGIVGSYFTYKLYASLKNEQHYSERQFTISELGIKLQKTSDYLGREAILYTISANEQHLKNFWHEVNVVKSRESIISRFEELNVPESIWSHLADAKKYSDILTLSEKRSMIAVKNNDLDFARELLSNRKYSNTKATIHKLIENFQIALNNQAKEDAQAAQTTANLYFWLSVISFAIFVLYIYSVCYFFLIKNIANPVSAISNSMHQIAQGDAGIQIPSTQKYIEIENLSNAASVFKNTLEENRVYAHELALHKENLEDMVYERTRKLDEANKELDEFSYRTSHDLRSPLVSSIGLLEIANQSIDSNELETAKECINHSVSSQNKLVNLVSDLLVLTQTKHSTEQHEIIDIPKLVDTIISQLQHPPQETQIRIYQSYQHKVAVNTEPFKFAQIVQNLVSNAIKYRDREKAQSWVKISTASEGNCFTISVKDNGLGIDPQHRDKLFSMFERFHANASYGSGLGLYLVRKTSQQIGGEIEFCENPEGGSEFIFTLIQEN